MNKIEQKPKLRFCVDTRSLQSEKIALTCGCGKRLLSDVDAALLTTDLSQMDVVSVSAQLKQRSRDPKYIKILEILFISTKLFDRFYWMHDQEQDIWICAKLKLSKNITHSSS